MGRRITIVMFAPARKQQKTDQNNNKPFQRKLLDMTKCQKLIEYTWQKYSRKTFHATSKLQELVRLGSTGVIFLV